MGFDRLEGCEIFSSRLTISDFHRECSEAKVRARTTIREQRDGRARIVSETLVQKPLTLPVKIQGRSLHRDWQA